MNAPTRPFSTARFSLRALLVAMFLVCCGFGLLNNEFRRTARQRATVQRLRQLGGHASYAHQVDAEGAWSATKQPLPGPALIRGYVSDDFLCYVARVSLHSTRVSSQDLQRFCEFERLIDLRLNCRKLQDDALSRIGNLQRLRRLDLRCSLITDAGIKSVGRLNNLRELDLYGTQVTDAGLEHLRDLKHLRLLKLRETNVTPEGAARLRAALPNCSIEGVSTTP